jgi:hypothetical protein
MEIRPPIASQAAHQRRGAADCGEYRRAVGIIEPLMRVLPN